MFILLLSLSIVTVVLGGLILKEIRDDVNNTLDQINGITDLSMSELEQDPIKRYNVFEIPDDAVKVSDFIYSLGKRNHEIFGKVESIAFVTIGVKKHHGMVSRKGGVDFSEYTSKEKIRKDPEEERRIVYPPLPSITPNCCSYLNGNLKWNSTQSFNLDPTNSLTLSSKFVTEVVNRSVIEWGFSMENRFIYPNLSIGIVSSNSLKDPNGINDISFAYISNPDIISVSMMYFIPIQNTLVEGDLFFNINKGIGDGSVDPSKFDLYTLSLKSFGSFFGLRPTQTSSDCVNSVMYPTISPGELKRTLTGDDFSCLGMLYSSNEIGVEINSASMELKLIHPFILNLINLLVIFIFY
jgi:hypothetical protein